MTPIDSKKILEEVRANQARLNSCELHDFTPESDRLFAKHKCSKCGGRIDRINAHWYQIGLDHGMAILLRPIPEETL